MLPVLALALALALPAVNAHLHARSASTALSQAHLSINNVPYSTRVHWMRAANGALRGVTGSNCPFAAFGSVIVNHTCPGLGELVCMGANANRQTGDPTKHGEIAAINNCSAILTDPNGPYNLTPTAALAAFSQFSLYTNAESCPMCASAIRWADFKEYIYGTSIDTLIQRGWGQIRISSMEVFRESIDLGTATKLVGEVLANETDPYFSWQFDPGLSARRDVRAWMGAVRLWMRSSTVLRAVWVGLEVERGRSWMGSCFSICRV